MYYGSGIVEIIILLAAAYAAAGAGRR